MLTTSSVTDGNMHPGFDAYPGEAQNNFDLFCQNQKVDPGALIGLRVSPTRNSADRIITVTNQDFYHNFRGDVQPRSRVEADTLLFPRENAATMGAFVHVADCFPVLMEGNKASALCHVGRKAIKYSLLAKTLDAMGEYDDPGTINIHIGPGVKTLSRIFDKIIATCDNYGVEQVTADHRDTLTDSSLFSRRARKLHLPGRVPGNQVAVMKPAL